MDLIALHIIPGYHLRVGEAAGYYRHARLREEGRGSAGYAMLRYAALCCAMLRYAALCCAMLRYAALCCAMLRYAMLCYAMLCYAVLCDAMLCYAMLCCAMRCYAMRGQLEHGGGGTQRARRARAGSFRPPSRTAARSYRVGGAGRGLFCVQAVRVPSVLGTLEAAARGGAGRAR